MSQAFEIGPLRDGEFERVEPMLGQALFFQPGEMGTWLSDIGAQHVRVARRDGRPVAGLSVIPMGQWFGGARVPTGGVTAVGVAPELRGAGVGAALLRAMLAEQRDMGVPLSALYPATVTFYRRSGYERAASRIIYELPLDAIDMADRELEVVEVAPEDEPTLRSLYTRRARLAAGNLDRPDLLWRNLLAPKGAVAYAYMVLRAGQPEGYVVFRHGLRNEPLNVRDLCALTPVAGRRLLTLLADHRTMVTHMRWLGGPSDPLLHLLPEPRHKVHWALDLMLRIVDVAAALAARGYPPGLSGALHLEVRDEQLGWNDGRFVLELEDGRPTVRAGGQGRVRLGVRELAALYSGHLTPDELRLAGAIDAPDRDLALAGLAFAGPRPWLPDMF